MIELLIVLAFVALALIRTPLYIILVGLTIYLFYLVDEELASIIISFTELSKQSILLAIPLFTFAGFLLSESNAPKRLVNLANGLFGFLPGGIAIVALVTCALFTAFTGASGVTIIALGGLLYPMLRQQNYPKKFSLGLMTTSGSLGLLFPPSLPIIIYGIVSETDITKLFKAGIIPGVLLIVILAFYAIFVGRKSNVPRAAFPTRSIAELIRPISWKPPVYFIGGLAFLLIAYRFPLTGHSFVDFLLVISAVYITLSSGIRWFTKDDVAKAFYEARFEIFLPILVLVGIYSGQFTATESASIAAVYVIIVECFVYRDIHFKKDLPRITYDSMVLVGAILIIMGAALAFTNYLVDEEIPDAILAFIQTYIDNKILFLIALNILLLIVGSLMDIYSALLVVVPLITPIAAEYGVDPVHLGIIFLTNLEIGYMTPPVGLNLFISSFRFEESIFTLYRSALVYIGLLLVALMIITYVPELSLFLVE